MFDKIKNLIGKFVSHFFCEQSSNLNCRWSWRVVGENKTRRILLDSGVNFGVEVIAFGRTAVLASEVRSIAKCGSPRQASCSQCRRLKGKPLRLLVGRHVIDRRAFHSVPRLKIDCDIFYLFSGFCLPFFYFSSRCTSPFFYTFSSPSASACANHLTEIQNQHFDPTFFYEWLDFL